MSRTVGDVRRSPVDSTETLERLLHAAVRVLSRIGFDGLTLRAVAQDADTATATVYTYFDSREQLVAEIVWRALSLPGSDGPGERPGSSFTPLTMSSMADAAAELGRNPKITELRDRLTNEVRQRVLAALGSDADPESAQTLERVYTDGLISAGLGYATRRSDNSAAAPDGPFTDR